MFFICCYLIATIINSLILLDKIHVYSKPMALILIIGINIIMLIPIINSIIKFIPNRKIKPKYSYSKLLKILSNNTNEIIEARYDGINHKGWGNIVSIRHEYNPYVIGSFRNNVELDTGNGILICFPDDVLEIRIIKNKTGKIKSIFFKMSYLFTKRSVYQLEYFIKVISSDRQWLSSRHITLSNLCDEVMCKISSIKNEEKSKIVLDTLLKFIKNYNLSHPSSFSPNAQDEIANSPKNEILLRYEKLLSSNWITYSEENINEFWKRIIKGD